MIAGVFAPDEGEIVFDDRTISGLRPDQVSRAGIGRTFQMVKPFNGLSVEDNVVIGALGATRHVAQARARAVQILERFGLPGQSAPLPASPTLPDRQPLEVARALPTRTRGLSVQELPAPLTATETTHVTSLI